MKKKITKFRAKNRETKEWIYFDLQYVWDCAIGTPNIDWNTLSESTGLKDRKSIEIWEGSILRDKDNNRIQVVEWMENSGMWHIEGTGLILGLCGNSYVIGDIYSNPELLVKKSDENDK